MPDTVRKPDPRIGPKAALIAERGESRPGANDAWPPTLHGTGTEDYFNTAWCPTQDYSAPYHGIIAAGGPNWTEPVTLYRWHIEDPVIFQKQIRVSIEHGHANRRSDDISSVAFWYQAEPHKPFEKTGARRRTAIPTFRAPFHNWDQALDKRSDKQKNGREAPTPGAPISVYTLSPAAEIRVSSSSRSLRRVLPRQRR